MSESESADSVSPKHEDDSSAPMAEEKVEESTSMKRQHDDDDAAAAAESEESENEWIGPLPTEAAPAKKKKGWFLRLKSECGHA